MLTLDEAREVRRQIATAVALQLLELAPQKRRAMTLVFLGSYARQMLAQDSTLTAADLGAIFTADYGAGPLGDEILRMLRHMARGSSDGSIGRA